jgi:hypothetical protein
MTTRFAMRTILRCVIAFFVLAFAVSAPAAPVPPADLPASAREPAPQPPAEAITADTSGGYARIVVIFAEPTAVEASISGRVVTVKLAKPIDADIVGLTRRLGNYITSVHRDPDKMTYRFTLGVLARVQTSVTGGRTAIDLVPESYAGLPAPVSDRPATPLIATAPPAAMVQAVPEQALPAQPAIVATAATAELQGDRAVLRFPQARGQAVAVFERGETTWIVLDRHPAIDATTLFANLSPLVSKSETSVAGTAFIIRLRFQSPLVAVVAEDETALTISFSAQADPIRPAGFSRASMAGLSRLRVQLTGAAQAIRIDDPDAGDRLLVVPARPGMGVQVMRRFVELETLPSTAGVAIIPHADDLSLSVADGMIEVSRPTGLLLSLL